MNRIHLGAVIAVVAGVLALGLAASAGADPVNARDALLLTQDCGGTMFDAVVNGRGEFTPAHELGGTRVFVPLQFLAFSGVFTDAQGNTYPESRGALPPKGSANPEGHPILTCAYTIDLSFPDGSTFVGNGGVVGFIV
jgi:hypothetical protein